MKPPISNIDELRHIKIYKTYGLDKNKWVFEIKNLKELLDFDKDDELFYWIAKEKIRFDGISSHNFIKVGSPYDQLYKYLCTYIDNNYGDSISNIIKNQKDKIFFELSSWIEYRKYVEGCELSRKLYSETKEKEKHDIAVKKRSEKATNNLFNAIRRKDLKAIVSLRIKGADINNKNNQGISALDYANNLGDEGVVNILIEDLTILKNIHGFIIK
ncbi:MAG TPA: hypothetical protein VIL99_16900 [Ignavibacteria bacterium]